MKKINRRKRYLIKSFQIKLLLRISGILIFYILILGWAMYFAFLSTLMPEVPKILYTTLLKNIALFIVPIFLITLILIVIYTHKIAGPVLRFEKVLEALSRGENTEEVPIRIRKGDELSDLAKKLNQLIVSLQDLKTNEAKGT